LTSQHFHYNRGYNVSSYEKEHPASEGHSVQIQGQKLQTGNAPTQQRLILASISLIMLTIMSLAALWLAYGVEANAGFNLFSPFILMLLFVYCTFVAVTVYINILFK